MVCQNGTNDYPCEQPGCPGCKNFNSNSSGRFNKWRQHPRQYPRRNHRHPRIPEFWAQGQNGDLVLLSTLL